MVPGMVARRANDLNEAEISFDKMLKVQGYAIVLA
ncbi:hypothetical protein WSK_1037 [Novosphingobium sp. Rr 2-17]|nr:hypothetical protein WSK_1037 [Novosphingobium sp. Rr 2-17]